MKLMVVVEALAVLLLLGMLGINQALALISSASDVGVVFGVLMILILAGVYAVIGRITWRYFMHKHLAVLVIGLALVGCARIDPGYVGVKVDYYGAQRGVQDFPLVTGMVLYNPITTSVFEYPTFTQTAVWTRDKHEGSPNNEEISFNSSEGLVFTADISLSISLVSTKVPAFYVKFRSDNINGFVHGFLRNVARDAFNESAIHYTAEQLYGDKKEEFLRVVKDRINKAVGEYGVIIEQFGFIGAPRPPANIIASINAKIAAIQDAIRVENELRSSRAQAQKAIADAEGRARSAIVDAEGQSKANALLSASITPTLLTWEAVKKWDGKRPQVEGAGAGLLLNVVPK